MTEKKPRKPGTFPKGKSGNPGGRPKILKDVQALARAHTADAIRALVDNLTDESGSVRNVAAMAILERGWGKPPQAHTGEGGEGPVKIVVEWQSKPSAS